MRKKNGDTHIEVGIVSWGINCAVNPGVYSRVSEALDFIKTQVCDIWKADSSELYDYCGDNSNFKFRDVKRKDCDWVAKKPFEKKGRCKKKSNGEKVETYCKEACGKC